MTQVFPAIGRLGLNAGRLAEYILASTQETLTDEELSKAIGMDTRPGAKGYSHLASAIRHCVTQGVVWRRIPRAQCIKRLNTREKYMHVESQSKHIGRVARRGLKVLHTVNTNSLSDDDKKHQLIAESTLGVIAAASSGDMRKKLEAREPRTFDPARLLEALTNGK